MASSEDSLQADEPIVEDESKSNEDEEHVIDGRRTQDEKYQGDSWYEQVQVEDRVHAIRTSLPSWEPALLLRNAHETWLKRSLRGIARGYQAYDSLQPWVVLWIVHSLNLLNVELSSSDSDALVRRLRDMRGYNVGGYGGGPRQASHVASTFAAVMALLSIGTQAALASIDVAGIEAFLLEMKLPDGSFKVSHEGESDARAVYCAVAVATVLQIAQRGDHSHALLSGVGDYAASLQAFDGGLAGEPGAEAHGGNTYCALAAATLAGSQHVVDLDALLDWAVMRQMSFEGGFQGRTNKLVDSCYSFWVGALFPILSLSYPQPGNGNDVTDSDAGDSVQHGEGTGDSCGISCCFNADALQAYVLECCQLPNGGLRDKPGVQRDLMHTCYALSGLSIAQHYGRASIHNDCNRVCRTDVLYNLREDKLEAAQRYFGTE